jgi:hypothetical protein
MEEDLLQQAFQEESNANDRQLFLLMALKQQFERFQPTESSF